MSKSTPDMPPLTEPICDQIGYCKPPKKSRWKKGQSGNPAGKKKGTKSFRKIFLNVAAKPVKVVNTNGVEKKRTLVETYVNKTFENELTGKDGGSMQASGWMQKYLTAETGHEHSQHGQVFKQGSKAYVRVWISQGILDEIERLRRMMPELMTAPDAT